MSLRWKFLFFLVAAPGLALIVFIFIASQIFINDKLSYVLDTQQQGIHQVGELLESHWARVQENSETLYKALANKRAIEKETLTSLYRRSGAIQFWSYDKLDKGKVQLAEPLLPVQEANKKIIALAEEKYRKNGDKQFIFPHGDHLYWFAVEEGYAQLLRLNHKVRELVGNVELFNLHAIDLFGRVLLDTSNKDIGKNLKSIFGAELFRKIHASQFLLGSFEYKSSPSDSFLVGFRLVRPMGLILVSSVNKSIVLRSSLTFIYRSVATFVVLFALAVLVSLFLSHFLTAKISSLRDGMVKVGEGDLDVTVNIKGKDELGQLGNTFNKIVEKLRRFVLESEDKVKLEKEMEVAHSVQETLLPEAHSKSSAGEIFGYYQPASYCGGDWWHYCETQGKVVLMIGDGTGHGVPAALTTSAVRSAISIVEQDGMIDPSSILERLNHCIGMTTRQTMNMTFFLCVIDKDKQEIEYANASHEFPYLISHKDRPVGPRDLRPLLEAKGKRLGEDFTAKFISSRVKYEKGDVLLLFTDGFFELRDKNRPTISEGRFNRIVAKEANESSSAQVFVENLTRSLTQYQKNEPLEDDLTMLVIQLS